MSNPSKACTLLPPPSDAMSAQQPVTYRPFYFVWVVLTVLCLLLALPLTIWDVSTHDHERTYIVWFVAGLFVLLAIPVSAYGVQVSRGRTRARRPLTRTTGPHGGVQRA